MESNNKHTYASEDIPFMVRPSYAVKIAVHVSRYCVQVFSLMQNQYKSKHGVDAKLQEYRKTSWSFFNLMVKQSTEEVIAADLLCQQLKLIIEHAVHTEIPKRVVGEVMADFGMTKYHLIINIMEDLATKGIFKEYESYINDSNTFALKWITQYTNHKMFSKPAGKIATRYGDLTKSHVQKIIRCLVKSVERATAEVQSQEGRVKLHLWTKKFCESVSEEIAVPVSDLKHVSARDVADFGNLQRVILSELETTECGLVDRFAKETADSIKWKGKTPYQQLLDNLWGCPEQCPFCREPCGITTVGHYSKTGRCHTCVQHRQTGVGGDRWDSDWSIQGVRYGKDHLATETCNYHVQWEGIVFNCRDCNFKCRDHGKCSTIDSNWVYHKNIEYKKYLQEWDIASRSY